MADGYPVLSGTLETEESALEELRLVEILLRSISRPCDRNGRGSSGVLEGGPLYVHGLPKSLPAAILSEFAQTRNSA